MNYESMSDLEINKLVKSKVKEIRDREFSEWSNAQGINPVNIISGENIYSIQVPDYCNSWADMGPIIDQENISLILDDEKFSQQAVVGFDPNFGGEGGGYFVEYEYEHKKILRAAAIVFLMSQESK